MYLNLFVTLLFGATTSLAQSSDVEREEWYLWTDDGARLYVTEFGQAQAAGDTVIVIHGGWGAEHSYLFEAVRPLTGQYHFVLYDQRGSLRSPVPDSLITYERMVADLEALREELGASQVTLLGHSMGTFLSCLYLIEHPARVRGLVMTGPVAPINSPEEMAAVGVDTSLSLAAYDEWRSQAGMHVTAEVAEEGLDRDSLLSKERSHKWRISFAGHNIYHVSQWRQMEGGMAFYNPAVSRALQANASEEWSDWPAIRARQRAALNAFQGPVRVILGDFDLTDPGAIVWPRFIDQLSDAEVMVLEEAGHHAWIDRPEAFRQALSRALEAATK